MNPTTRRFAVRPLSVALHGVLLLAPLAAVAADGQTPQADQPQSSANTVQLDKLTVTAQKREEQVADVPLAISAYSGGLLQKLGVVHMDDLSNYVPGFYTQLQSPNNPGYVVRGITSDDTSPNQVSRVSIYQDGVDISAAQGANVALFDMQRVEVLRGPQGTLFGRGAEAGAVSLIQNKATDKFESGFNLDVGNYSDRVFSAYINGAINDGVDGRLAVYDSKHDGYYKNDQGGSVFGEDTQAVRGSLHFDIGQSSKYDVIANWEHDTPPGTDFTSSRRYDSGTGTLVPNNIWGDASLTGGKSLGVDRVVYGITGLGEFSLSDAWTLSSITGLRTFHSDEKFDADGTSLDLINAENYAKEKQGSQELRFNYDSGGRVRAFTGVDFFYQQGFQRVPLQTDEQQFAQYILLPSLAQELGLPMSVVEGLNLGQGPVGQDIADNINPVTGQPFNNDYREGYELYSTTRAYEAFGDVTVDVSDNWSLTAGARVSREQIYDGYRVIDASTYGSTGTLGSLVGGTNGNDLYPSTNGQRLGQQQSFTSAVGRLVANYRFGDDSNFYVNLSRGRKPDVLQYSTANQAQVLPAEIINSAEIGLKGDIGKGRLLYDIDAFYYGYKNFQTSEMQGFTPVTVNAGRARAPGVELSLQENFSPEFAALLNYTWMHARFAQTDENGDRQEYAGNMMRMSPDNSVSLALLYQHGFGGDKSFYFRPNYRWKSKMYFDDDNNGSDYWIADYGTGAIGHPNLEQKAYGTYNLRTGFTFQNGRWDVGLWGANLANKKYLIDAGNTGMDEGFPTYIPGAPRTYGVSISGKF